eukprot:jgi/Ulvmu1/7485/UM037_0029.1
MHFVEVRLPTGSLANVPISGERVSAGCVLRTIMVQCQAPLQASGYITCGSRLMDVDDQVQSGSSLRVVLRVCGGKGGYGNTLRAMGRKGGNTNDVGDCRDLSGRRLRDVQAAERASTWVADKRKRDEEEQQLREVRKLAASDARKDEEEEIKKALQASRLEKSTAENVVAQGLKHQATQAQASTSKPVRKMVSDPYNESDSESSSSEED